MGAPDQILATRIASSLDKGKRIIHIWAIDGNGEKKKFEESYVDFFYINQNDVTLAEKFKRFSVDYSSIHKTWDGERAYKVSSYSIQDKKNLCTYNRHATYEADLPVEFKYFMENNMKWSDKRHIVYFDIEIFCEKDEASRIDVAYPEFPITAIQLYSTEQKRYFVFTWHPSFKDDPEIDPIKIEERGEEIYFYCKDEEAAIVSFMGIMKQLDPDLITGWYSAGFDLPYLINRCSLINIDANQLSPLNYVKCYKSKNYQDIWKVYITGLDHIDMLDALKDLNYNLSNWKLATAALEILGGSEDVAKLEEFTWRDWKTNFDGFLKYCIRDVKILKDINEKLNIFGFYVTIQKLTNIPQLSTVMMKSLVVDYYILTEYNGQIVFPTSHFEKKRRDYMGAMVLDPQEPGLQKNVSVVDYSSLYPSVIIAFNISPETFVCSNSGIDDKSLTDIKTFFDGARIQYTETGYHDDLFGKSYLFYSQNSKLGILPTLLLKLLKTRKDILARMANETDVDKKNMLDKHQIAVKVILNSAYGALGFPYFRLYKPECADAITYFSRNALLFLIEKLKEKNLSILYSDTDSAFFKNNDMTDEQVSEWITCDFKRDLDTTFVPTYNHHCPEKYKVMNVKVEKFLDRVYFSDAKKRYYGIEKNSGKKYIRGINIIRKDAPKFLKTRLNDLVELAVKEELTVEHLDQIRLEIETVSYEELGIPKNFSRNLDEYRKNNPQHLKGVQFANSLHNLSITHKDVPYLFYIISLCEDELKPSQRNKVICLRTEDLHFIPESSHLYQIDYVTFFDKQVLQQLDEFGLIESTKNVLKQYRESRKNVI